jgi:predicted metal-dependent peptidase
VDSAFDNLSTDEQGKVHGDIRRLIDKRRAQVDWREYLRATTMDVMAREDYTLSRPSRRSQGAGCYLPGLIGETNTKLMLVIDTSASVGKDDLDQFVAEIDAVKEYADRTDVVSVDTVVHYPIDTIGPGDSIADSVKPRGGGGTSFTAVFEDIESGKLEAPEMLIYLTDGYASFPTMPPGFPVMWVITGTGCDLSQIPFGMKLKLD